MRGWVRPAFLKAKATSRPRRFLDFLPQFLKHIDSFSCTLTVIKTLSSDGNNISMNHVPLQ